MLTDLEAVFRSLKLELGVRPVYHHKEERIEGHLFIYYGLGLSGCSSITQKAQNQWDTESWISLRQTLSVQ